jgi:hypothetical protein
VTGQERYPSGTVTVKGATFDVWTDDAGTWHAMLGEAEMSADTKTGLSKALGRAIRDAAVSVSVPFLAQARDPGHRTVRVRSGVATGIHATTHGILITWDDTGEKATLSRVGPEKYLNPATADPAEWKRLSDEYLAASRAVFAYEETHKFALGETVQAAMRGALLTGGGGR